MRYFYLFTTILMLAGGQLMFKNAATNSGDSNLGFVFHPIFITAVALYGVATLMWIMTLKSWPITVAYPCTALAIVLVVLFGVFRFDESLSTVQVVGIGTIISGVLLLTVA